MVHETAKNISRAVVHSSFLQPVPQGAWGSRALAAIVTSPVCLLTFLSLLLSVVC